MILKPNMREICIRIPHIALLLFTLQKCDLFEERSKLVCIFSTCDTKTNLTILNKNARLYKEFMMDEMTEPCLNRSHCHKNGFEPIKNYQDYDVCEDQSKLMKVYLDLLLDAKNHTQQQSSIIMNEDEIVFVVVYIGQAMFELLGSLFFLQNEPVLPLISLNPNLIETETLKSRYYVTTKDYITFEFPHLVSLLDEIQRKRAGILFLESSKYIDDVYFEMYNEFVKFMYQIDRFCFFYDIIDMDDKEKTLQNKLYNLREESYASLIILFGHPDEQQKFIRKLLAKEYSPYMILLHEIELQQARELSEMFNRLVLFGISNFHRLNKKRILKLSVNATSESLLQKARVYTAVLKKNANNFRYFRRTIMAKSIDSQNRHKYFILVKDHIPFWESYFEFKPIPHNLLMLMEQRPSTCQTFICPPGWQQTRANLIPPHKKWTGEYGQTCKKCQQSFFKSTFGNQTCERCPSFFTPDSNRTYCYDPYEEVFLDFKHTTFKICFITTICGCVINLFFLVVFLKNINTPAVKSTNFPMTALHMISSLLLCISMLLTHYGKMKNMHCFLRVVSFSFLYTFNVSVVLMKSHTLLKAFKAKRRPTKKDKVINTMQQYFTILMIMILGICLSIGTFIYKKLRVVYELDEILLSRYSFCSSQWHLNLQISYVLVLQCFCFASAYRGRNLPGVFNEAMPLIYVSLITTLGFGIMFPIHHFQKDPLTKSGVQWLVIVVNNTLFLVFCYGRKVHFMIFKAGQNNKSYYQRKTFLNSQRLSGKVIRS